MTGNPLRYLLLPVSALRLFSGYKSFRDPYLGSVSLNRRGLHVWRLRLAHAVTRHRRKRLEKLVSDRHRDEFAANGFVEIRDALAAPDHAALLAELRSLSAPAREMKEGAAVTRRIGVTPDLLADMPALRQFLASPEWSGLTRYVGGFDAEPIVCVQTIFGEAASGGSSSDPQTRLHTDTFHPTMKAWLFLEDVAPDQGPFTYVPGSHLPTERRQAWHKRRSVLSSEGALKGGAFRVTDAELRHLHLPPRHVFAVPGNTLVVADTFGLHARGLSARSSTRVEIYASMRPNPFNPLTFLDTAWIPLVRGRKVLIGWWLEDMLVCLGLGRRIWKAAGRVNPWQRAQS
ncbi:phytanoyl-CoA dioxygenase family protein [Mesorhizobium sp. LHD-90]|uniref:phytanoyl-CoA dioxygenase family protein n=1 Tax=Mesorhizobium sp. LHD-90 TaxID=3071414 RepID=UPI0027E0CDE2|nr:phytanoyl-CoA dioxygenase family protein [Mesorhizobium sp. LHD-90]MDQ6434330.1 phytanoyl-CoA dioxygenase family protein [Mesorhizobium sp. LHD-90]